MTRINHNNQNAQPVSLDDFTQLATDAAGDDKLSAKEKRDLTSAFKSLDRSSQIQAIDFLKSGSPVLAKFAQGGAVHAAENKRVGGDESLDAFNAEIDRSVPNGINTQERSSMISDFRALAKCDQKTVLAALQGSGQTGLAEALDKSIRHPTLTPKQEAQIGTKSLDDFASAVADLKPNGRGRAQVVETFRKLTEDDKQAAIDSIKDEQPALAQTLDRILNPRPGSSALSFNDVV